MCQASSKLCSNSVNTGNKSSPACGQSLHPVPGTRSAIKAINQKWSGKA